MARRVVDCRRNRSSFFARVRCGLSWCSTCLAVTSSWYALAVCPTFGLPGNAILEGVRSYEKDSSVVVAIDLSEAVDYAGHTWSSSGTALRVRFRRAGPPSDGLPAAERASSRSPHLRSSKNVVSQIELGSELVVTVTFSRPLRATVYLGGDRRTLVVEIPAVATGTAVPDAAADGSAPQSTAEEQVEGANRGERSGRAMSNARRAMTANDYATAIRLLTKVLRSPDSEDAQEAKELLGVARERNHQLAHAKAEYEEYLALYPHGEGADRVRQRLAALLSPKSGDRSSAQPKSAGSDGERASLWGGVTSGGSFSQYFRMDDTIQDDTGARIGRSFVDSDLDVAARVRRDDYDGRLILSANYRADIEGGGSRSNARIRYLFADLGQRDLRISGRFGRQSRSSGGVQGRFDGVHLSYGGMEPLRFHFVGGSPVNFSGSNRIDTDRLFYGASLDVGRLGEHWDLSGFFIEQTVDGSLDRRAVGAEARYHDRNASMFALVDYDVSFQDLNTVLLFGNYRFDNAASVGLTVDLRSSPALRASNALIGQEARSIGDLRAALGGSNRVRDVAKDRTARSTSVTLFGAYPLAESVEVASDFTVSELAGTPESAGVPATPSTGLEYYWNGRLAVGDLVVANDLHVVGLRLIDTNTTDTLGLHLSGRFPDVWGWRANPRLRLDFQRRVPGALLSVFQPSLVLDFRWASSLWIDLEAGYEWLEEISGAERGVGRQTYYLYAGYRWEF